MSGGIISHRAFLICAKIVASGKSGIKRRRGAGKRMCRIVQNEYTIRINNRK
jgi:hypothetical protein